MCGQFFLIYFIVLFYLQQCFVCICMCTLCMPGTGNVRKGTGFPWNWSYGWLLPSTWVMGTKLWSSAGAASVLPGWATCPGPLSLFVFYRNMNWTQGFFHTRQILHHKLHPLFSKSEMLTIKYFSIKNTWITEKTLGGWKIENPFEFVSHGSLRDSMGDKPETASWAS